MNQKNITKILCSTISHSPRNIKNTNAHTGEQCKRLPVSNTNPALSILWLPKNFKGGIRSLFDPCVNTMGQRPYCSSRMEMSYCTFGFSVIIQCNLCTLSLPRDSPRNIQYDLSYRGKGKSCLTKLFGGLSYEKIRRYSNSPPYVTARWPPQQIPPLNFLGGCIICPEICKLASTDPTPSTGHSTLTITQSYTHLFLQLCYQVFIKNSISIQTFNLPVAPDDEVEHSDPVQKKNRKQFEKVISLLVDGGPNG